MSKKFLEKWEQLQIPFCPKEIRGRRRTLKGGWAALFSLVALFMSGWYMYTSGFGLVSSETNRGFYLMCTSVLVFLLYPATSRSPADRPGRFDVLCIFLVSLSIGYWINQYAEYAMFRVSDPTKADFIMGVICLVMVVETTRRALGIAMPILAVVFLAQLYYGPMLPGKLAHAGVGWERIIEFIYSTQEGIFGTITTTFATFVFPFMIFGAFLERSGAGSFFMELATSITGRWRGGPAKIAVVTSALFGSISGSSVANVVSTGTFTIPMMKRLGFKAETAGAIEAVASTGGQFMPPVMGAGVFILATLIEMEYLTIAALNVIPALIYFMFVLAMVDLEALRNGLKGLPAEEIPDFGLTMRRGWYFFLPLVVVLGVLYLGYSPEIGAFYGTLGAIAVSFIRKETRMTPKDFVQGMVSGAQANNSAGAAIGSLGIIIGGIVLAGLGLKFSAILVEFSRGNLVITSIMVMIISIIVGMGSSTTGAYIILSVVAAPALIHLGVSALAAHLMVFYAACLSNVTPPVCVSAFAGAAIAGADPMKTGFVSLKYSLPMIFLPLGFVFIPGLLLEGSGFSVAWSVFCVSMGFLALAVAVQGTDFINPVISVQKRFLFGAAACFLLFPTTPWIDVTIISLLLVSYLPGVQGYRKERESGVD